MLYTHGTYNAASYARFWPSEWGYRPGKHLLHFRRELRSGPESLVGIPAFHASWRCFGKRHPKRNGHPMFPDLRFRQPSECDYAFQARSRAGQLTTHVPEWKKQRDRDTDCRFVPRSVRCVERRLWARGRAELRKRGQSAGQFAGPTRGAGATRYNLGNRAGSSSVSG